MNFIYFGNLIFIWNRESQIYLGLNKHEKLYIGCLPTKIKILTAPHEQNKLLQSTGVHLRKFSKQLCKKTQSPLKTLMASTAAIDTLQISTVFTPQVFMFVDANHISLSLISPHLFQTLQLEPASKPVLMGKCTTPAQTSTTDSYHHGYAWG